MQLHDGFGIFENNIGMDNVMKELLDIKENFEDNEYLNNALFSREKYESPCIVQIE